MQRNTKTTVGELKTGDRFYKTTGKKTEIYEHRGNGSKPNSIATLPIYGKKFIEELKKDIQVIFLRNINEQSK